jgi:protein SCO1/2
MNDRARRISILCTLGLWLMLSNAWAAGTKDGALHFGEPPMAGIGGDLPLTDVRGRRFSFKQLGDTPALVFFGFLRCSSVCPLALLQARQLLGSFNARPAPAVIFVTLDPLNDDATSLAQHLGAIDPRIIGLTGSPAQIESTAARYGVATRGQNTSLEHSSRWYLVTAAGVVQRVYDNKTTAHQMAQDVARLQASDQPSLLRAAP